MGNSFDEREDIRQRLLEWQGLKGDPEWEQATLEEVIAYRQKVPFYHFWYWEYQRRNQEYIAACSKREFFRHDHAYCRPDVGPSSTDILNDLCKGTFEHMEPKPRFWFTNIGKDRAHIECKWTYDSWGDRGKPKRKTKISITFDPDLDKNLLLDHIQDIIDEAKKNKDRVSKIFEKEYYGRKVPEFMDFVREISKKLDVSTAKAVEIVNRSRPSWLHEWKEVSTTRTLTDLRFQQNQESRPRGSDEQRAIGLWLWDYIKANACTQNKAIQQLNNTFDLSLLGYAGTDYRTFKKWEKWTRACIEAADVLPFSDKINK